VDRPQAADHSRPFGVSSVALLAPSGQERRIGCSVNGFTPR
jgi:hypothetical protein